MDSTVHQQIQVVIVMECVPTLKYIMMLTTKVMSMTPQLHIPQRRVHNHIMYCLFTMAIFYVYQLTQQTTNVSKILQYTVPQQQAQHQKRTVYHTAQSSTTQPMEVMVVSILAIQLRLSALTHATY